MDGPYKMQGRGDDEPRATDVEIATREVRRRTLRVDRRGRAWVFDELFDKMVPKVAQLPSREDDFSNLEIPEERRAAPRKASEANEPVKVIGGVRYDRKVLDDCRKAAPGSRRADAREASGGANHGDARGDHHDRRGDRDAQVRR